MRRFSLLRDDDPSGVSGTGQVAEGCLSTNGKVALFWTTRYRSVCLYDSLAEMEAIHGHGGKTHVHWLDASPVAPPRKARRQKETYKNS